MHEISSAWTTFGVHELLMSYNTQEVWLWAICFCDCTCSAPAARAEWDGMYRLYVCVCIFQEELQQSQNHFSCTFQELLASYTQLHVAIPSSGPVPRIHAHCPAFVHCVLMHSAKWKKNWRVEPGNEATHLVHLIYCLASFPGSPHTLALTKVNKKVLFVFVSACGGSLGTRLAIVLMQWEV